jgi:hypothetical protein
MKELLDTGVEIKGSHMINLLLDSGLSTRLNHVTTIAPASAGRQTAHTTSASLASLPRCSIQLLFTTLLFQGHYYPPTPSVAVTVSRLSDTRTDPV